MKVTRRGPRLVLDLDACLTIAAGGVAVALAWNVAPTGLSGLWAALTLGALAVSVARPHSAASTVAIAVVWLWWCLGRPDGHPDAAALVLVACCFVIHIACARRMGPVARHPSACARQRSALAMPLAAFAGSALLAVAATLTPRDLAWAGSIWLELLAVALLAICAGWLRTRQR